MIHPVGPFGEPVDAIKALLGSSYEKEYSALSDLCGLIRARRPQKIIKAGGANSSVTAALLCCMDILKLSSQVYVMDACNTVPPYTKEVFDLKVELGRRGTEYCHFLHDHTLAAHMDEIGAGVDMLIVDATEAMPNDILDFLAAFPYLTHDAVVAVCNAAPAPSSGHALFQSVTADKLPAPSSVDMELHRCIQFITTETISVFQVNSGTAGHIVDLFVALKFPWKCAVTLGGLLEYKEFIDSHYGSPCAELYRQAVIDADPYRKMLEVMGQTLLKTFPQILLYGKGKRGKYFGDLATLTGIPVSGFIVSDGRDTSGEYKDLPVYEYSRIPFPPNEVFIFQTALSKEVQELLRQSPYHWMSFPETFWNDIEYEEYLSYMIQLMEKNMRIEGNGHTIWTREGITV